MSQPANITEHLQAILDRIEPFVVEHDQASENNGYLKGKRDVARQTLNLLHNGVSEAGVISCSHIILGQISIASDDMSLYDAAFARGQQLVAQIILDWFS